MDSVTCFFSDFNFNVTRFASLKYYFSQCYNSVQVLIIFLPTLLLVNSMNWQRCAQSVNGTLELREEGR